MARPTTTDAIGLALRGATETGDFSAEDMQKVADLLSGAAMSIDLEREEELDAGKRKLMQARVDLLLDLAGTIEGFLP
jgi:hypothetical protein